MSLFLLNDIFKMAWQGREEKSTFYYINESLTLDGRFPTALVPCLKQYHQFGFHLNFMQ